MLRSTIVKVAIIGAVLIVAPFAVPFALEFVLMVDLLGLEALVLFLLLQFRQLLSTLSNRLAIWLQGVFATLTLLASLYMFQPKVFFTHAVGSSMILVFACSLSIALALWLPPLLLSSGGFL
ncbi:MAG: hypothetical protein RKH07_05855 [Gammaproteobacteria bacterium]